MTKNVYLDVKWPRDTHVMSGRVKSFLYNLQFYETSSACRIKIYCLNKHFMLSQGIARIVLNDWGPLQEFTP